MIAAIYARKSTAQDGVAEEAKSVTRQVENATAYAKTRGWSVSKEHVYIDDGISGAEFEKRPGLSRLRSLLDRRAPFQILIVSERKSIGREMQETGYVIKQLDEAGVAVWSYSEDRCLTPRSAVEKIMSNVQGFADEDHREKTSQRVIEAHTRLALSGHVTGGRIFGYRNRDVIKGVDQHGRPLRSHVELVIEPEEAEVVQRIFALYDAGEGLKRIAKLLTVERALSPKPFQRNDGLSPIGRWTPSTVRAALTRELYHGVKVWNKTRKKNHSGKLDPTDRPESEWLRVAVENLRLIEEPLWQRVAAKRRVTEGRIVRFDSGLISGRPPKHASRNLLAGLATCGTCGGGLIVEQSNNSKGRYAYYACHRRRQTDGCSNHLRVHVEEMNEAVLEAIEQHALTPEAIEQVIVFTERDDVADKQKSVNRERKDIDKRIERLVAAIEAGGEAESLVAKLRQLEERKATLAVEADSLQPVPRLPAAVIEDRLMEWRRILRQSTTLGRTVLQRVVRGRITFTPRNDGNGYDFQAPTRFDRLFTGIAIERPKWVNAARPHKGCEDLGPEETMDGDYGRILDRAYGKGVVRPARLERATSWFVARRSIQLS